MTETKGFILAGAKCQYDYFVKTNNLNKLEFPYLKELAQLAFYKPGHIAIIKVGTYYMNPLYHKILKWEESEVK